MLKKILICGVFSFLCCNASVFQNESSETKLKTYDIRWTTKCNQGDKQIGIQTLSDFEKAAHDGGFKYEDFHSFGGCCPGIHMAFKYFRPYIDITNLTLDNDSSKVVRLFVYEQAKEKFERESTIDRIHEAYIEVLREISRLKENFKKETNDYEKKFTFLLEEKVNTTAKNEDLENRLSKYKNHYESEIEKLYRMVKDKESTITKLESKNQELEGRLLEIDGIFNNTAAAVKRVLPKRKRSSGESTNGSTSSPVNTESDEEFSSTTISKKKSMTPKKI